MASPRSAKRDRNRRQPVLPDQRRFAWCSATTTSRTCECGRPRAAAPCINLFRRKPYDVSADGAIDGAPPARQPGLHAALRDPVRDDRRATRRPTSPPPTCAHSSPTGARASTTAAAPWHHVPLTLDSESDFHRHRPRRRRARTATKFNLPDGPAAHIRPALTHPPCDGLLFRHIP